MKKLIIILMTLLSTTFSSYASLDEFILDGYTNGSGEECMIAITGVMFDEIDIYLKNISEGDLNIFFRKNDPRTIIAAFDADIIVGNKTYPRKTFYVRVGSDQYVPDMKIKYQMTPHRMDLPRVAMNLSSSKSYPFSLSNFSVDGRENCILNNGELDIRP
jgi:hypothetical protein